MDVRCERCQTEYELEESAVTEAGTTEVQCTACGHTFFIGAGFPGGASAADAASAAEGPPPAADWLLETPDGQVHRFRNLTSLQKWIIERKVTREDRISKVGHGWRRLGDIVELVPFFDIVDEADRARAAQAGAGELLAEAAIARQSGLRRTTEETTAHEGRGGPRRALTPLVTRKIAMSSDVSLLPASPEPELGPRAATELVRVRRGGLRGLKVSVGLGVVGVLGYVGLRLSEPEPLPALDDGTAESVAASAEAAPSGAGSAAVPPPGETPAPPGTEAPGAPAAGAEAPPVVEATPPAVGAAPPNTGSGEKPRASRWEGAAGAALERPRARLGAAAAGYAAGPAASGRATGGASSGRDVATREGGGAPIDRGAAAPAGARAAGAPAARTAAGRSPAPPARVSAAAEYDALVAEADRALENGARAKAARLYDRALALRPGGVEATAGVGYVMLDRSRADQAIHFFKKALEGAAYPPAIFGLAEAQRALGARDEAIDAYERYLTVAPKGAEAPVARRQLKALSEPSPAEAAPPTEDAARIPPAAGETTPAP